MAAAVAERDVCYFTYKDNALTRDIYDIHKLMTDKLVTVGTHAFRFRYIIFTTYLLSNLLKIGF